MQPLPSLPRLNSSGQSLQQPFEVAPLMALNQPQRYSGEQLTKAQRDEITRAILAGQFPSAGVPT